MERHRLTRSSSARRRILAVASGGGHWIQLRRLEAALDGHEVTWVAADPRLEADVPEGRFETVQDASREDPMLMLKTTWQTFRLVWRTRPDIVVTTGAAPGLLALVWGRLLGARTIWIDSVANAEELSMSGRLALYVADEVLTQWSHLAVGNRPRFEGSVL